MNTQNIRTRKDKVDNPHQSTPVSLGGIRGINYHWRVNEFEQTLLDTVMRPYQWRDLCVLIALTRLSRTMGVEVEGRLSSLKDIDLDQLIDSMSKGLKGRQEDDEDSEG